MLCVPGVILDVILVILAVRAPHLDPKRAQGPTKTRFYRFPDEKVVPLGGLLGHLFGTFFWCEPPGH